MTALGLMLALMHTPPGMEEEFSDWYDTEHLPQRRGLPGFLNGARWACLEGFPSSLAAYDLTSLDALQDPAYLAVGGANSTPWSKRVLGRTARTARMRVEVEQIWPGTATFLAPNTVSRLLAARYAGVATARERDAIAETKQHASTLSGLAQMRLFTTRADGVSTFWLLAEFSAPTTISALAPVLGQLCGQGADVFNLYAPHDKR